MGNKIRNLVGVIGFIALLGCSGSAEPKGEASDAAETVIAMLEVAEAGNWETYVDTYYGEQDKFRDASDREKLVERFRTQWGPQTIEGLKKAKNVTPTLSEDGQRAIFTLDEGQFILHLDSDGNWTFHL